MNDIIGIACWSTDSGNSSGCQCGSSIFECIMVTGKGHFRTIHPDYPAVLTQTNKWNDSINNSILSKFVVRTKVQNQKISPTTPRYGRLNNLLTTQAKVDEEMERAVKIKSSFFLLWIILKQMKPLRDWADLFLDKTFKQKDFQNAQTNFHLADLPDLR